MRNSVGFCWKMTNRIKYLYLVGVLILLGTFIAGVMNGSTELSFSEVLKSLSEDTTSPEEQILIYVRIPRTLAALVCGAALAVSGAVIQSVLANRLASPGIIGVNSGAALAVTVCTALGIYGGWQISLFSFIGAFCSVMIVSLGAKRFGASRGTVILLGVAMNSLLGAFSDMIITFVPEVGIMSNDFKIGEFSSVTYQTLIPPLIIICITILIILTLRCELDVISFGDENARGLGMNPLVMRVLLLMLAALLAGCAVSIAGLLSFVGLIVPHLVRRISGNESGHVIGLCAIYGGAFVSFCDIIARTLFSPYEVPVGMIMAFLGAPFFIFILIRGGKSNA